MKKLIRQLFSYSELEQWNRVLDTLSRKGSHIFSNQSTIENAIMKQSPLEHDGLCCCRVL